MRCQNLGIAFIVGQKGQLQTNLLELLVDTNIKHHIYGVEFVNIE